MQIFRVVFFWLLVISNSNAQSYLFYNSIAIDGHRYDDIKRAPYLYESWGKAKITNRAGLNYSDVEINYNGYEKNFEVRQLGHQFIIDDNLYDKIVVNVDGKTEWFIRGVHYDLATELANVIYNGSEVKLIRYFSVRVDETIQDSPGETLEINRFASSRTYALLYKGKLKPIQLREGKISKALNSKELIKEIADEENIKFGTEEGIIKLLSIFEKNEN